MFQGEFHSLFVAPLSWKGPLLGDIWTVKDSSKLLRHSVQLVAIGFLSKHHCKFMFNEDPRQELVLVLKVNLDAFCHDVSVTFLAREVLRMFCLVCGCNLMLTLLGT
jgi:hypothetical protein